MPSHQDSPKVPETWPQLWVKRLHPRAVPTNLEIWGEATREIVPHPNEDGEFETYIPVSALLSDEAKAAAHHAFVKYWAERGNWSIGIQPPGPDQMDAMDRALTAAIEHVGGGQGG